MNKIKIYTPMQIFAGSFLCGPAAAVIFLKKNYEALDRKKDAKNMVIIGSLLSFALMIVLSFFGEKIPHSAIPVAYCMAAYQVANMHQMSKKAISESEQYEFQPLKNVFIISVIGLVIFVVIFFAVFMALYMTGLIKD